MLLIVLNCLLSWSLMPSCDLECLFRVFLWLCCVNGDMLQSPYGLTFFFLLKREKNIE